MADKEKVYVEVYDPDRDAWDYYKDYSNDEEPFNDPNLDDETFNVIHIESNTI